MYFCLSFLLVFPYFIFLLSWGTNGEEIVTKTTTLTSKTVIFSCNNPHSPVWTKYGDTIKDVQNLAFGAMKLPQFLEDR